MKKVLLIGLGFVLAVAVFGGAGFAYAQTQDPPEHQTTDGPEFPYGRAGWSRGSHNSMMGERVNAVPGGMMGFAPGEGEPGWLHDYLWPAVAEAFNMTNEQIEAFELVRETMQGIRENFTQEEIRETMQAAMITAIENALADGAITEEQADIWLERLNQMEGFVPGIPHRGRGRTGSYRQGFSIGVKFGRQMIVNPEYLDAAIADRLDLSVEKVEELKTEHGLNLKAYADEQGLSEDELTTLRLEIFTNAVNMALEDGAITQGQADWVLERLENLETRDGWFGLP